MADRQAEDKQRYLLVAAIDFGTTYSGWAYQFNHQYDINPAMSFTRNWSDGLNSFSKTPTTVLIHPDGQTLHSFGFDAASKFADLTQQGDHTSWFYFNLFKMKLYHVEDVDSHLMIDAQNGKQLPAMHVFSIVIEYLKDDLMSHIQKQLAEGGVFDQDILWVLTVPAIWNDRAKQFMRQAAIKAGINGNDLRIALEPEAASIFCKQLSLKPHSKRTGTTVDTFSAGQKYLVIDAGGGTIDINVHEVQPDGNLRELHKPSGSNWGGSMVGRAFEEFLCQLFGQTFMSKFEEEYLDDFQLLLQHFEASKRKVIRTNENSFLLRLPITFIESYPEITGMVVKTAVTQSEFTDSVSLARGGKLKIGASLMKDFFEESIYNITTQVETVLKDQRVVGCNSILMVGGYSEADILREEIKQKFPHMDVITPSEASVAVLKGAVIFGRNPQVITSRVCKYTYGVKVVGLYDPSIHLKSRKFVDSQGVLRARNVFDKIVEVGQDVTPGHFYKGQYLRKLPGRPTTGHTALYASTKADPKFIDEEDCFKVGDFPYDFEDTHGNISRLMYMLQFGATEIEVVIMHETTGEKRNSILCLPD